jgi:hypothetical protein
MPIPVLIHRRRNHVSLWLSSAFEAEDCSHFGRALQPFQQSLLRPGMSGNCDCFIGTVGLFVSIAPRGTTNQFDNSSRVAIQDDPISECTSIIDGDMAPATAGELVCNLGFDCPGESHCKDKLASVKLRFLRHSQWLVSPSDIQRNWEADQYGIWGQLRWQNGLFRLAQKLLPTRANWARQLHSNAEANRTLLAGEIGPE